LKRSERAVISVIITTGISSVVTQLLTIREFMAQFNGNELVIALVLFIWLLLGGMGTAIARMVPERRYFPATSFRLGWISLFLAALPVLQILAIRQLRDMVFIPGSSVGFYPTLGFSLMTLLPYGMLLGFALPYSLLVLRKEQSDYSGARVYIWDNMGDVAGGALFSFLLVQCFTPMQSLFFANLSLLFACGYLLCSCHRHRISCIAGVGSVLVVLLAGLFLELPSLSPATGDLAYYRETKYGRIEIHRHGDQLTLFSDGVPMFSNQNVRRAEEGIHYALSQVNDPESVLIISSQGGMMEELRKYQLERVDYLEIDSHASDVQFRFGLLNKFQGLNVIHRDGRVFLRDSKKKYDAIIMNLPEPDTFQMNRFFTDRFFELARSRLSQGGVLGFSVDGFENYLAEPQRQKLSSIYNTVSGYFDHVLMIPGGEIYFICSTLPLDSDIPTLLKRKSIPTQYVSNYYSGNITQERIRTLNTLVDVTTPINRDVTPRLIRIMFTQWFFKFSTSPFWFVVVISGLGLVYLTRINRVQYVLFSTGCTTMGSEVLVIFAFQIFFGYVYLQIGLIVTVFLAGLLPGAYFSRKFSSHGRLVMIVTDGLLVGMMLVFIGAIHFMGDCLPVLFFLFFGFAISFFCGCQFPAALSVGGEESHAAVGAFSADLVGAAFGIVLVSIFLIPYLGLFWAAFGLALLKMTSLIMLGSYHEKN
jgi:spermidine synthase